MVSFNKDFQQTALVAGRLNERSEGDAALLRGCLSGREADFSAFYRRLSPPLFGMVYQIVQHQTDAEDVLQEVFVQLWKKGAAYDPARGTVFTWSVMIARHKAIDRLRARQRRHQLVEAATAESEAAFRASPSFAPDPPSQRGDHERVHTALSHISPPQRAAIELAFFSGLTQPEIAEKLGAPLGTIKARIRRGLLALRDGLTKSLP